MQRRDLRGYTHDCKLRGKIAKNRVTALPYCRALIMNCRIDIPVVLDSLRFYLGALSDGTECFYFLLYKKKSS